MRRAVGALVEQAFEKLGGVDIWANIAGADILTAWTQLRGRMRTSSAG